MPTPEQLVTLAITQYLNLRGHVFKRNQSGMTFIKGPMGKTRAIRMGEKGWPDLIGLEKGTGRFFGIEVKAGKNKATPEQEAMLHKIRFNKGIAVLAYSVDEVVAAGL